MEMRHKEAIIQDHAFQCALVDIMLPGRDGYSLLPKLKQYEIPVIFLTAREISRAR